MTKRCSSEVSANVHNWVQRRRETYPEGGDTRLQTGSQTEWKGEKNPAGHHCSCLSASWLSMLSRPPDASLPPGPMVSPPWRTASPKTWGKDKPFLSFICQAFFFTATGKVTNTYTLRTYQYLLRPPPNFLTRYTVLFQILLNILIEKLYIVQCTYLSILLGKGTCIANRVHIFQMLPNHCQLSLDKDAIYVHLHLDHLKAHFHICFAVLDFLGHCPLRQREWEMKLVRWLLHLQPPVLSQTFQPGNELSAPPFFCSNCKATCLSSSCVNLHSNDFARFPNSESFLNS